MATKPTDEHVVVVVQNFIDGVFRTTPTSGAYVDSRDPSTGDVWARVPDSDEQDVDEAVTAANRAFQQ